MKSFCTLFALLFWGLLANAAVEMRPIEYKQGSTPLEGYLADDTTVSGKRPGIIMVHDWMGIRDTLKERAERLAKSGYVVFAADIYGKDIHPKDSKEAGQLVGKYKSDRKLMRARIEAALKELKKQKNVDPDKIAVMGYCFGGTVALELGRDGAPIKGIVTFHGGLDTPTPQDAKNIKGKVLVLHGADDPHVPPSQVAAFEDEMRKAGVDWELVKYSKAVHAFTIPDAGNDVTTGAAYNAEADRRSWLAMKNFLEEIFGPRT